MIREQPTNRPPDLHDSDDDIFDSDWEDQRLMMEGASPRHQDTAPLLPHTDPSAARSTSTDNRTFRFPFLALAALLVVLGVAGGMWAFAPSNGPGHMFFAEGDSPDNADTPDAKALLDSALTPPKPVAASPMDGGAVKNANKLDITPALPKFDDKKDVMAPQPAEPQDKKQDSVLNKSSAISGFEDPAAPLKIDQPAGNAANPAGLPPLGAQQPPPADLKKNDEQQQKIDPLAPAASKTPDAQNAQPPTPPIGGGMPLLDDRKEPENVVGVEAVKAKGKGKKEAGDVAVDNSIKKEDGLMGALKGKEENEAKDGAMPENSSALLHPALGAAGLPSNMDTKEGNPLTKDLKLKDAEKKTEGKKQAGGKEKEGKDLSLAVEKQSKADGGLDAVIKGLEREGKGKSEEKGKKGVDKQEEKNGEGAGAEEERGGADEEEEEEETEDHSDELLEEDEGTDENMSGPLKDAVGSADDKKPLGLGLEKPRDADSEGALGPLKPQVEQDKDTKDMKLFAGEDEEEEEEEGTLVVDIANAAKGKGTEKKATKDANKTPDPFAATADKPSDKKDGQKKKIAALQEPVDALKPPTKQGEGEGLGIQNDEAAQELNDMLAEQEEDEDVNVERLEEEEEGEEEEEENEEFQDLDEEQEDDQEAVEELTLLNPARRKEKENDKKTERQDKKSQPALRGQSEREEPWKMPKGEKRGEEEELKPPAFGSQKKQGMAGDDYKKGSKGDNRDSSKGKKQGSNNKPSESRLKRRRPRRRVQ